MVNNKGLKMIPVLLLLCVCSTINCLKSSFTISKTYLKSSSMETSIISMGKLKIFEEG